ncbi:hypothetical protein U9M48_039112 [Paspalum notatum var. saurae]|uniref:Histone-lysine N-methyltransferase, H3 lysine-9 specific SUVH5 n=1 Tax=Paspalum notatum var. saurae TaxID=547442 RepID=A0AAQ3XBR6_PASNO
MCGGRAALRACDVPRAEPSRLVQVAVTRSGPIDQTTTAPGSSVACESSRRSTSQPASQPQGPTRSSSSHSLLLLLTHSSSSPRPRTEKPQLSRRLLGSTTSTSSPSPIDLLLLLLLVHRSTPPPEVSNCREQADRGRVAMDSDAARAAGQRRRPPGAAGRVDGRGAWPVPQRSDDRRGLRHRPLPPRPPLPPPPRHGPGDTRRGGGFLERGVAAAAAAAASGANAAAGAGGLVGDGTAGVSASASAVTREETGGGDVGTKRRLPPPAAHPPPKRVAVSATRQFRPGRGPHEAASLASDKGGSAPASALAGRKGGALLAGAAAPAATSLLNKFSAVDGGGPVGDGCGDHGPEAAGVVRSSEALRRSAVAAPDDLFDAAVLVEGRGNGAESGELGREELLPHTCLLRADSRTFLDDRSFPAGCGKDAVLSLLGGGGIGEVCPADGNLGVLEVATDGGCSSTLPRRDMEITPPCCGTIDGAVQDYELEEGEIPPEVEVQQVQVPTTTVALHEPSASRHGASVREISAVESSTMQSSDEKTCGSTLLCGEKGSSCSVADNIEVTTKYISSSHNVVSASFPEDWSKQNLMGKTVFHNAVMNMESSDVVAGVCGDDTTMKSVTLNGSTPCRHRASVSEIGAVKASAMQAKVSNEKIGGNVLHCGEKTSSCLVTKDAEVTNKSIGISCDPVAESLAKDSSKQNLMVSKSDIAAAVPGDGITMRSKVRFTPRKVVKPVKMIQDTDGFTTNRIQQAPMFSGKLPVTQEKDTTATRGFFGPRKKVKVKVQSHHRMKIASACALGSDGKLDDEVASNLEDDDILKALIVNEGSLELFLNSSPGLPSTRCQQQYGSLNADARSNFKKLCRRFEFVCRALVQAVEQQSLKIKRIDLEADKVIKKLPGFTKPDPIVGQVPGVEVGDEFLYRVQLAIVGLHRAPQGGIDTTTYRNGERIAISIVASGGYPDELSCSGELIYTGSGGKPTRSKKYNEDQKLESGNLALKNCIKTKTPVRVIYGFKVQNAEGGSHSRAKKVSTFTYDGLYHVVDFWIDGQPGSKMFKYKLRKIPGQPELPMHIAKEMRKSKTRPGLCMVDLSQGEEETPICVINTVDDVQPAPFRYTTAIKYPIGLTKTHHHGCDCMNGCSDTATCACAVKNGGEIPFNLNGAIVNEKHVIFECGPSCKCPPSCQNRVSQHGMKIPLEVFRTTKRGWGVRSLRSISSGSFICEYVGELLYGKEADKKRNNDYLFDIGLDSCFQAMEDVGFTLDAAEYGNIGRFINHSCSPNLYTQNVLWDHDDKRMPHIMLFAAQTIPPLQELTYNYNYEIDHVEDENGRIESKVCQCGSPQCSGRLY